MATMQTTTRLRLVWRDRMKVWLAQRDPLLLIAAACLPIIALLIVGAAIRAQLVAPAVALAPTPPLPIIIVATARAVALPTPAGQPVAFIPGGPTLARVVVAYDAPNGRVIGAIDSGRRYVIVARFGADWLQADVTGSGLVWLRMADLFDLPPDIADLQPSATPLVVTVPSAPQTVYVAAPVPAAPSYQVDSAPAAQPTMSTLGEPTAEAAYRAQIGLNMSDDQLLADHQRQQAGSCDRGVITDARYCAAVREWIAAHP